MSARLVPLTRGALTPIPVQRPVVLIGRHPECDARIDLPKVSRRHCCVAQVYDRIVIRDLGSRNGVRVNGRIVDEIVLEDGDEIAVGPLIFRLETDKPPPVATTAPAPASKPLETPAATRPPSLPSLPPLTDDIELIPLD